MLTHTLEPVDILFVCLFVQPPFAVIMMQQTWTAVELGC